MVKGLGHISIDCTDINRSVSFYTQALGFKKTFEKQLDSMIIVFLKTDTFILELVKTDKKAVTDHPNGAINHFALIVDDIEESLRAVKAAGQPVTVPKSELHLDAPLFYAFYEGPDRERVELVQYR